MRNVRSFLLYRIDRYEYKDYFLQAMMGYLMLLMWLVGWLVVYLLAWDFGELGNG